MRNVQPAAKQRTPAKAQLPAHVRITTDGRLAEVPPACEGVLKSLLTYTANAFRMGRGGHLEWRREDVTFCEVLPGGNLSFPAGLTQRVQQELQQHGVRVDVVNVWSFDGPEFQLAASAIEEADRMAPGLAAALQRFRSGLIETAPGPQRGHVIGQACRLMHNAKIFVASATVDDVNETAALLGQYLGGEVDAVRGREWRSPCRVVVGTFASLDSSDPVDWNVVIYADAIQALGLQTHSARAAYRQHRFFGFIAPGAATSRRLELSLETLAGGPVIYSAGPRKKAPRRIIDVAFAEAPLQPAGRTADVRMRKQELWAGDARNKSIADLANGFATRNPEPLWQHGLFLKADNPFARWNRPVQVAVLVEFAQHADQLATRLRGWQVLHARPGCQHGHVQPDQLQPGNLNDGVDRLYVPPMSIITTVRADKYDRVDADVLIMAAGGACPQLPRGLWRRQEGHTLVVDLADDSDSREQADTRARRQAYERAGCTISQAPRWLGGAA